MTAEKSSDEIYCQSCGEIIKRKAEICPECGVPNEQAPAQKTASASHKHDPSNYETTVNDTWYYGVAISAGLWVFVLITTEAVTGATETFIGLLGLIAWILMPVSVYFDTDYIRANGPWNPNTTSWVIGAVIPGINIATGLFYLYRRHEVMGEP